jgi:hypothetical protein
MGSQPFITHGGIKGEVMQSRQEFERLSSSIGNHHVEILMFPIRECW